MKCELGNFRCSICEPIIIQNDPNDPLDQVKPIDGMCFPKGHSEEWLRSYIPSNDEYEFVECGGHCNYCSLDIPKSTDCNPGCASIDCCAISGVKGCYKRIGYNADPEHCCIFDVNTIGDNTCDPKYKNPKNCSQYLRDFCTNDLPFRHPICKKWCGNGCKIRKAEYCNEHIFEPFCQEFCHKNNGLCDSGMEQYCKVFPDEEICSCINSKVQEYNPICVDRKCIDHGYQTISMMNARGQGCQIIDCKSQINLENQKIDLHDIIIEQNCGQKKKTRSKIYYIIPILLISIFIFWII
jgi:hypothetical protein